ncbi:MAG: YafY family protein [Mariprofundaceae bacterium]
MDKFDRIYQLHRILDRRRYPVSIDVLCGEMECSQPTVKRIISQMRLYYGAPIVSRRGSGYLYEQSQNFELPGLWFNQQELEALLIMNQLLAHVGPGLLEAELAPAKKRLEALLARLSPNAAGEVERIRILDMAGRGGGLACFSLVAAAVLERKRLTFDYDGRSSGISERREVSPQRLIHYRDNWYLDAFCHLRDGLRTFSLDRISKVVRGGKSRSISKARLDRALASSYGVFSGTADKTAVLHFTRKRAQWVADEIWHLEQKGGWLPDGRYELRLPYDNALELILDICRYGPDVEVMEPDALRDAVAKRLRLAAAQYADGIEK